jgi:hypothetical protein
MESCIATYKRAGATQATGSRFGNFLVPIRITVEYAHGYNSYTTGFKYFEDKKTADDFDCDIISTKDYSEEKAASDRTSCAPEAAAKEVASSTSNSQSDAIAALTDQLSKPPADRDWNVICDVRNALRQQHT